MKIQNKKVAVSMMIIFAVMVTAKVNAQTNTNNYIITKAPRISGIVNDSTMAANAGDKTKMQIAIQYVDGLGRAIQAIQKQGSPLGYDVILPSAYDQYGREITKYLPFVPQTGTSGTFRPNAVSTYQGSFYTTPPAGSGVTAIANPYAQTTLESSPLSRPLEQGAPGAPWQLGGGHTVRMSYTLNNATAWATDSVNSRQVAYYYVTINSNFTRVLHNGGYVAANALTVTITKDENWISGRAGTLEEYRDIDGQVILKRAYNYVGNTIQQLSTYYVYDDMGKLAYVLPPSSGADGAGAISQTTLNNLCYQYQYDELGRIIGKKIPGKGWQYSVYNILDQLVATQDSLQRSISQWEFVKYDVLGRAVVTGIWNNGGTAISRAALQTTLSGISTNLYEAPVNTGNGYTNVAWPTTAVTATLTINFYDMYTNIPSLPAIYTLTSGVSLMTRSLPTVKKTAILNTPANQLWDVIYYDDLGRATKTYAQHYLGGTLNTANYDLNTTTYNFTNAPTTTIRQHWNTVSMTVPLITVANTYIYDHAGRKVKTWEQITNGNSTPTTKTLISKTDYNEIGQILTKHLHSTDSTTFLQDIAYTYNERGWLISSTAALFKMQLNYNTSTNKSYNGNIMYQNWGPTLASRYAYTYDKLNRLTSGVSLDNYKEFPAYDLQGNITSMSRYQAGTLIDALTYTYSSTNQLQSINDATTSDLGLKHGTSAFTYDGNGNMLTDPTKGTTGITISYNLLNLPQSISGSKTITYTYDAAGIKLRKNSTTANNITDYISGIQYDGVSTPALSFIQTEEGKAVPLPTGNAYNYVYYLGDNLGNIRAIFETKNGTADTVQRDDYYPFGMEINRYTASPKNEYLYNKKELQEELQEYDYGARFYDPVIARWNTIDPLAEKSRRWSPYNYVENNPIRFTDPDGMSIQQLNRHFNDDVDVLMDTQQSDAEARAKISSAIKNELANKGEKGDSMKPVAKADALVNVKQVLGHGKDGDIVSPSDAGRQPYGNNMTQIGGHESIFFGGRPAKINEPLDITGVAVSGSAPAGFKDIMVDINNQFPNVMKSIFGGLFKPLKSAPEPPSTATLHWMVIDNTRGDTIEIQVAKKRYNGKMTNFRNITKEEYEWNRGHTNYPNK